MTGFEDFLARKRAQYGDKFDPSNLSRQFIPYFNSRERISVKFSYGGYGRGRVGVTTGWKPVFLLVKTSSSTGSSDTLSDADKIVPYNSIPRTIKVRSYRRRGGVSVSQHQRRI